MRRTLGLLAAVMAMVMACAGGAAQGPGGKVPPSGEGGAGGVDAPVVGGGGPGPGPDAGQPRDGGGATGDAADVAAPAVPACVGMGGPPPAASPGPTRPRPFFPRGSANAAAAQAIVDGFTEDAWRRLVPRQSPRDPGTITALARCLPAGATRYTWSSADPDRLTFVDATGKVVAVHPSDGDGRTIQTVMVLSGRTVEVPVWNLGGANTACYLQQIIDHEKDSYLRGRLNTLSAAYANPATRNEAFARRIAIALDEWAKHLPHYYLTGKNGVRPLSPAEAFPMGDIQRVSDHNGVAHEVRAEPVTAFDAVYDSPALAELSRQLGYDVRARITSDFFDDLMDYIVKKIPLAVHVATNLSGSFDETARLATILRRPDLVEWLNQYLALSVLNLGREGMLPESMSYNWGYITENRSVAANVRTYFQIWPATDERLRTIQRASDAYHAAFARGVAATDSVRLPDGMMAPFGNTPIRAGTARQETRSVLLPGYGHLTLGDGSGAEQVQVNFGFNDNANHCEQDVLHFTLFGFGKELISDIRYSRMPGRPWTESTMAHNTVAVNRRDQYRGNHQGTGNRGHLFTAGNLLLHETNLAGVSVAEVDGSRAYTGTVSRYQRLLVLNARETSRPYLLDFFRVKGGQTHDYFMHGATLFDMTVPPPARAAPAGASSLPLALIDKPYPLLEGAEMFVEPPRDAEPWYGAFRDVWTARSNGNWNVTFQATASPHAVRITMLDAGDVEVFVAKSPAPHRDGMPDDLYAHWRPSLLARRRAAAPAPAPAPAPAELDSLFVAVIEPLQGAPSITRVERLPVTDGGLERVALRLTFGDGAEDVVLVDLANPAITGQPPGGAFATADGQFTLDGRVGIASRRAGATRAYLVGGTRFEAPSKRLAGERGPTGAVTEVVNTVAADPCSPRAFVTDAALPTGEALRGRWLRLSFANYKVVPSGTSYPLNVMEQKNTSQFFRIDRVAEAGGRRLIVLAEDPMLTIKDGVATETTRPARRFEGPFTFEIVSSRSE